VGSAKRERQKAGRQARLQQAQAVQARRQRWKLLRNLGIVAVVVIALLFLLSRGGDDDVTATATTPTTGIDTAASETSETTAPEAFTYGTGPCPAADGSSPQTIDFTDAPQQCIDPAKTYTAVFDTTAGTVRVDIDTTTAPGAANNFVVLSRYHYFDGTALFRTDTSIGIIQGGSPHTQDNGDPGPGYTIPDEGFGDDVVLQGAGGPYSYEAGDLVYARPGSTPDSSSAQFFFCVDANCANLDSQGIYIEFGHVTEGLDILEGILATDTGGAPDPVPTVNTVTIEES
jgi:peptidyl-prolyl cis-trans isomerase B (cyclophilin B)